MSHVYVVLDYGEEGRSRNIAAYPTHELAEAAVKRLYDAGAQGYGHGFGIEQLPLLDH